MSIVMATFVLVFVRSYEPSFYTYGAVSHAPHAMVVKGHVTQGTKPVQGVTVKILEDHHGHWDVAATGWTNNNGLYNMRAPEPTWQHIRVEWVKPHTVMPILIHEFRIHGRDMAFGLDVSPVFRFLATQAFSY